MGDILDKCPFAENHSTSCLYIAHDMITVNLTFGEPIVLDTFPAFQTCMICHFVSEFLFLFILLNIQNGGNGLVFLIFYLL